MTMPRPISIGRMGTTFTCISELTCAISTHCYPSVDYYSYEANSIPAANQLSDFALQVRIGLYGNKPL